MRMRLLKVMACCGEKALWLSAGKREPAIAARPLMSALPPPSKVWANMESTSLRMGNEPPKGVGCQNWLGLPG